MTHPAPPNDCDACAPCGSSTHRSFKQELDDAFIYSAWDPSPEFARKLDDLRLALGRHVGEYPQLLDELERVCTEGEQARAIAAQLIKRLAREGDCEETRTWLQAAKTGTSARIGHHLDVTFRKQLKRRQAWQRRLGEDARRLTSNIAPVCVPLDGHHPNSLRHLPASAPWRILIDETGSHFDEQADVLSASDSTLGRLVALAIPAATALPPLTGFHAVAATVAETDAAVGTLLGQKVGVFGFTVQDPAIHATRWIGHVVLLARWVLAQLPLVADAPCEVEILIEQNKGYQPGDDLRALREMLESELQRLSPTRYAKLRLHLGFMAKTHDLNGYVDAIAFTWGSQAAASQDRLKKTGWLGHCLLRPNDRALERLYLALHAGRELPPAAWYDLCAAAADEPPGGLLNDALNRLGGRCNREHWNASLAEVRQRLQSKRFALRALRQALAWLERWAAPGTALPPAERLALEAARLALDNHLGGVDQGRVLQCLDLIHHLHDEAPREACEALLRITVATTNVFEFAVMEETMTQWLAEPVAVPGLLNHAKLHSTLGQIAAFQGEAQRAMAHFERAIAAFQRLSDPDQAAREIAQTRSYRLIAAMDAPGLWTDALQTELMTHFAELLGKHSAEEISRSLAHSGQDRRYAQHLWLRMLVTQSGPLDPARSAYLTLRPQWQSGPDHPWPLIDAYRGWLLHDAGLAVPAAQHLGHAVAQCEAPDNGPTLHWMGAVLRVLAQALGVALATEPGDQAAANAANLPHKLPAAPHDALAEFARLAERSAACRVAEIHVALCRCLPFNFH